MSEQMTQTLAHAFGVDGVALEKAVAAYENPDRLALIEARWREAGCGDADKAWLIDKVKQLRRQVAGWQVLFCPE